MLPAIVLTLLSGLIALACFMYYWNRGQFDDAEDVKYQLFHDEEDEE